MASHQNDVQGKGKWKEQDEEAIKRCSIAVLGFALTATFLVLVPPPTIHEWRALFWPAAQALSIFRRARSGRFPRISAGNLRARYRAS